MVWQIEQGPGEPLARVRIRGLVYDKMFGVFSVALVVGGSIVIPHLRRAVALLEQLQAAR